MWIVNIFPKRDAHQKMISFKIKGWECWHARKFDRNGKITHFNKEIMDLRKNFISELFLKSNIEICSKQY